MSNAKRGSPKWVVDIKYLVIQVITQPETKDRCFGKSRLIMIVITLAIVVIMLGGKGLFEVLIKSLIELLFTELITLL